MEREGNASANWAARPVALAAKVARTICPAARKAAGDRRGSVAIYFSLAMIPTMMMVGAAIDYGRALSAKAKLQTATDAAALAVVQAANSNPSGLLTVAQNNVYATLGSLESTSNLNLSVGENAPSSSKPYYEVTASITLPTAIMNVAGYSSIAITTRSGANYKNQGTGNGCVLSLDNSAVDALWDNGNAAVSLTNCDIYDNSANGAALVVSGSSTLSARSVNVVGGVSGASQITTTAGINTGVGRTTDPYRNLVMPAYAGCDQTNYSTNKSATLSPGVYCGGISINSTAVVQLNPGLYVIDGGTLSVNGSSTLTSATVSGVTGVTIVFTSSTGNNWPTLTFNGGATINLTAPSVCSPTTSNKITVPAGTCYNGILFYGDRNMAVGTAYKINGGSAQILSGAIYLPEAAITYAGTTAATNPCLQVIGDTIDFKGTSTVAISGCGIYSLTSFGQSTTGSNPILME